MISFRHSDYNFWVVLFKWSSFHYFTSAQWSNFIHGRNKNTIWYCRPNE